MFTKYVTDLYELKKTANDSVQRATAKLSNNKVLVKYSDKIPYNIKKLYKENQLNLTSSENNKLSKTQLKELDFFKKRGVPSAVHIASAIAAYARILINEYKNISDNPCIMSDTDSVVLPYPLSEELVGKELGQLKLEYNVKKAIFIRKKLYYILTQDNQEVIKASGIDSSKLNYKLFLDLLNGKSITVERTYFRVVWKDLILNLENSKIVVRGLTDKLKTLDDLIKKTNFNVNKKESDFFILFSKFEIISFIIFIFILFIFI